MKKKCYTVIGFYSDSGHIFAHQFEASSGAVAMYRVAQALGEGAELVATVETKKHAQAITFPGDSVTDRDTYIERILERIQGSESPESSTPKGN